MIAKTKCIKCGESFEDYSCNHRKYCSQQCANMVTMKNRSKESARSVFVCDYCNRKFSLLRSVVRVRKKSCRIRFCFVNGVRSKEKKCPICIKMFVPSKRGSKFCTVECFAKARYGKPHSKVTPGYWYESGYRVVQRNGEPIKHHRLVMEEFIGRKLLPSEFVHHKNHKREDNRIENLEVLSRGEHSRLHRLEEVKEGKPMFGRKV